MVNLTSLKKYRVFSTYFIATFILALQLGCDSNLAKTSQNQEKQTKKGETTEDQPSTQPKAGSKTAVPNGATADHVLETFTLFDGKTLDGWAPTNFGTERECSVKNGNLYIEAGYPISGVTSTLDDLPLTNYELTFDGKKNEGTDFFCCLTFPVDDSHCSVVLGGWGGVVCGLSCIDEEDASNNESRTLIKFETEKWYKIKVQVRPKRIQVWLDEKSIIDQNIDGKKISLRNETLPSRPLGICTFETTSEFKNIELCTLKPLADQDTDTEGAETKDDGVKNGPAGDPTDGQSKSDQK